VIRTGGKVAWAARGLQPPTIASTPVTYPLLAHLAQTGAHPQGSRNRPGNVHDSKGGGGASCAN